MQSTNYLPRRPMTSTVPTLGRPYPYVLCTPLQTVGLVIASGIANYRVELHRFGDRFLAVSFRLVCITTVAVQHKKYCTHVYSGMNLQKESSTRYKRLKIPPCIYSPSYPYYFPASLGVRTTWTNVHVPRWPEYRSCTIKTTCFVKLFEVGEIQ